MQNGAKFYLGNTNGFIKVDQTYKVNGTSVSTYNATGDVAIENAALFEIADYAYNAIGDFSMISLQTAAPSFSLVPRSRHRMLLRQKLSVAECTM